MNKFKKLLLATAVSSVAISGSAFAQGFSENQMYISLSGGMAMPSSQKTKLELSDTILPTYTGSRSFSSNYKGKMGFIGSVGVGYYVDERARLELMFIKPVTKGEQKTKKIIVVDDQNYGTYKSTAKYDINALQLRGYFDVVEIADNSHLYIGAGVGVARVKVKVTSTIKGMLTGQPIAPISGSYSTKAKTNFCGSVALGVKFEVADGIDLGAEYNFSTFGKGKAKKSDGGEKTKNVMMHSVVAKVAFKF